MPSVNLTGPESLEHVDLVVEQDIRLMASTRANAVRPIKSTRECRDELSETKCIFKPKNGHNKQTNKPDAAADESEAMESLEAQWVSVSGASFTAVG